MTRLEFLRSFLGLGVGAVAFAACGNDTGDGETLPDGGSAPPVDGNAGVGDAGPTGDGGQVACAMTIAISFNHGHALAIPAADLASTAAKTYQIQGTSDHPHTIVLTPAHFAMLRAGDPVSVVSSVDDEHPHTVTVTC